MPRLLISVATTAGTQAEFSIDSFDSNITDSKNDIQLSIGNSFPYAVKAIPPQGETLQGISYRFSTDLTNFHQVIVPDTGRGYISQMELVSFWASKYETRVNNIRMPLYMFTGQDQHTALAFGVIGSNYETTFTCKEPALDRALMAYMQRLSLEIERGNAEYPIPAAVAQAEDDGSITEYLYIKEGEDFIAPETWFHTLRDFSGYLEKLAGNPARTTDATLEPWWCSWTDWHSDNVTDRVVLDNVKAGLELGIKNYIIDDGWFGPGLDSSFDIKLNIGDWAPDPQKFPDLKATVDAMHAMGANAIIWCAPHAVSADAECFEAKKQYLIQNVKDEYVMTYNGFHTMCFCSPEARQAMADICVSFIEDFDTDGAKYDLFNCVPGAPCVSTEHSHDTESIVEGLQKMMEEIDNRTRALKPDYIVELKQNYGTPWLHHTGTVVRAGDTPYNPEGNFRRTAYINAYTPYSHNDYQSINNHDSIATGAAMIIKMLAVGVPTYSMDLPTLNDAHKKSIAFFHKWYADNMDIYKPGMREPANTAMNIWKASGTSKDIFYLINDAAVVNVKVGKKAEILNGTFNETILLQLDKPSDGKVEIVNAANKASAITFTDTDMVKIPGRTGDLIKIRF